MLKLLCLSLKFICFALLSFHSLSANSIFEETKDLPVAYEGRFRSLDSASRLWLYDFYHQQRLKKEDLISFETSSPSALDFMWKMHFFGHTPWDNAPFFWMHYASLKSLLKLKRSTDRFSFKSLYHALYENSETNLAAVKALILSEFAKNNGRGTSHFANATVELQNLSKGLFVTYQHNALIIAKTPSFAPWNFLKAGMTLSENAAKELADSESREGNHFENLTQLMRELHLYSEYRGTTDQFQKPFEDLYATLQKHSRSASEIALTLEARFPFIQRLQMAGTTLKMLPIRSSPGEWVSLHAFKTKNYNQQLNQLMLSDNFTSFSDEHFYFVREAYFEMEKAMISHANTSQISLAVTHFADQYKMAYRSLAGKPYQQAEKKGLSYPTESRLQIETLYYRLPLIEITLMTYALALLLRLLSTLLPKSQKWTPLTLFVLLVGFSIHTAVLILRCYILQRPPVSNMFETMIYVPWIAVAIGFVFYSLTSSYTVIAAAVVASLALLVLLKLTQIDARLENVQAVLDSQYWLIIHVLMVVGSYGAFAVSGVLGHFYLIGSTLKKAETSSLEKIARSILHTMYVGLALLIPGTILGGIWAAESWGRFWDWDPKESWAFISACVYLLFVHAYTFHHIKDFGLAVGSIAGLTAISFTWYGVNYILGTGLHSYGFGKGGEMLYFLYLIGECLFVFLIALLRYKTRNSLKKIE